MRRLGDRVAAVAFLLVIGLTLAFLMTPVVIAVAMSVDSRNFLGTFPPTGVSGKWYVEFVTNDYYMDGLKTSVIVASSVVVISVAFGTAAALFLDQVDFPGRSAMAAFLLSPLVVPTVVLAFGLFLLTTQLGIQSGYVRLIGGHSVITFPFVVRTVLASLSGIRPSLREAALTLGAREWKVVATITLPLAKTGVVAGAIFTFAFSFDDIVLALFLSDAQTYTLPVALVTQFRQNFDLSIAAASALIIAFTIVLVVVADRWVGLDRLIGTGVYRA